MHPKALDLMALGLGLLAEGKVLNFHARAVLLGNSHASHSDKDNQLVCVASLASHTQDYIVYDPCKE